MKNKPHSKLPFKVNIMHSSVLSEDLYLLEDADDNDIGGIEYAGDIDYIEEACNNYQKAVELLTMVKVDAEMALNDDWDRSNDGFSHQIEFIDKFLNKVNNEKL